ncbi:hypothetical protein D3C86_1129250 [compost metagenome]
MVVLLDRVQFTAAPQFTATVVLVRLGDLPAVFVHIEATFGVDVPCTGLEGRFDHPHAVLLVAGQVLIDVVGLDHGVVLEVAAADLVAVVRDEQLLLAHQFPVETVRRAVVAVDVIGGDQAIAVTGAVVVGDHRRTAHATLPRQVLPGRTRLGDLVDRLVHQHRLAGQTRRFQHPALEHEQDVRVGLQPAHGVGEVDQRLVAHVAGGAVFTHQRGAADALVAAAAITGHVVPHHLQAFGGQRKRNAPGIVVQAVAAVGHAGLGDVLTTGRQYLLGQVGAAMARVDVHLVGVGKALEQRDLARAEKLLVLRHVLRGDSEQGFLGGIRIAVAAFAVDGAGVARQAAGPGRNAAVGIGCHFRAHGGQGLAQCRRIGAFGLGQADGAGQGQHAQLHTHNGSP